MIVTVFCYVYDFVLSVQVCVLGHLWWFGSVVCVLRCYRHFGLQSAMLIVVVIGNDDDDENNDDNNLKVLSVILVMMAIVVVVGGG